MKVKLDDYYVRVLINGLFRQHRDYDEETNDEINSLLIRLVDISDSMKPNRRKKIEFTPSEATLIVRCLTKWRNMEIQAEKFTAAEVIGELLMLFVK